MSRKPIVLVTLPEIPQPGIDILKLSCDIIHCDATNDYASIFEKCKGVSAILWAGRESLGVDVINAAGCELKVITTLTNDHSHIDTKLLNQRGIIFGCTPVVLDDATADLAICLLLASARRFHECRIRISTGKWEAGRHKWMLGYDICGKTVGFYGFCDISIRIMERLKYFNVTKFLYVNTDNKNENTDQNVTTAKEIHFNELLSNSDFIFITTMLTRITENKFDKYAFSKMKKTAILINTSRAQIIDQTALYDALNRNTIYAAGLDKLIDEPCLPEEPLLKLNNCVITPHIASATQRTREDMAIVAAHNILRGLAGEPLLL